MWHIQILKPCRECTWQPGRGIITALNAAKNVPKHGINPWLCSLLSTATPECCKARNNQTHSSQTHSFSSTFFNNITKLKKKKNQLYKYHRDCHLQKARPGEDQRNHQVISVWSWRREMDLTGSKVLKWKINNEENHSKYSKPVSTKYYWFQNQPLNSALNYNMIRKFSHTF